MLLVLPLVLVACDNDDEVGDNSADTNGISTNSNSTAVCKYADRLEFPHLNDTCKVIVNLTNDTYDADGVNYCVEWDSHRKTQRWSCYQMHTGYSVSGVSRFETSDAATDPQYPFDTRLASGEYYTKDPFTGSGYDHGHMCPSADRLYSSYANWQTFYLTNMQPQANKFNAGIWEKLESQIRSWASAYSTENMYVVKGGTVNDSCLIGHTKAGLPIPRYYFSAILVKNAYGYKAIAFWFDQTVDLNSNAALGNYAISVDELEKRTGIDFFCNLPDDIEAARESRCDLTAWGL